MTKFINIVESLGHYGLKSPAQAKTENSDFLRPYGKNVGELAFGKK